MNEIKIAELTDGAVRNLAGHERGVSARNRFRVSELDQNPEVVTVVLPPDLDALTTSFFQGMFGDSIHKLGRERFEEHYRFAGDDFQLEQVERGIRAVVSRPNSGVGLTEK